MVQVKKRKKKSESEEDSIIMDSPPSVAPRKTAGRSRKPVSYAIQSDDDDDSN